MNTPAAHFVLAYIQIAVERNATQLLLQSGFAPRLLIGSELHTTGLAPIGRSRIGAIHRECVTLSEHPELSESKNAGYEFRVQILGVWKCEYLDSETETSMTLYRTTRQSGEGPQFSESPRCPLPKPGLRSTQGASSSAAESEIDA